MYRYLAISILLIYAILGVVNVYFGRLTSDEGWYTYAANIVYKGHGYDWADVIPSSPALMG